MANSKRKCAYCKKRVSNYIVFGVQAFCDIDHATKYAYKEKDKGKAKIEKEQRQKDHIRKEALKTAGDYTKEAQASINKYVRIRDKSKSCVSCGSSPNDDNLITGTRWDAGHYRSRGSASHLRFNLNNIHKQCVKCNRFNSGNAVDYRIKLIDRIGLEKVEKLESDNEPRKFTIEYLKRIKRIFNKKARLYEKKFR